jgi:hypothetical protein
MSGADGSMRRVAGPAEALRRHGPDYLFEAGGLLVFMLGAGAFTTLFEHPGSPFTRPSTPDSCGAR